MARSRRRLPMESAINPRTLTSLNDTADPVALIRNGWSAQGVPIRTPRSYWREPPVNLLGVIARPDGREWAKRKARLVSIAAGRFAAGTVDPIIRRDVAGFASCLPNGHHPWSWPGRS